ncbi:MAG: hypothetical protein ACYDA6_07940 [Solirubrobacteraceae bacterium]
MARVLIVGEGERAMALGEALAGSGHAARVVVQAHPEGPPGERLAPASGVELIEGDPNRLATMRGALERVTVACWLFGSMSGAAELTEAIHGPRLTAFMGQVVDSSARAFLYESAGSVAAAVLDAGAQRAREIAARNAIALALLDRDPADRRAWLADAMERITGLIGA